MAASSKPPKLVEVAPSEIRTVCWNCGDPVSSKSLWCDQNCRKGRPKKRYQVKTKLTQKDRAAVEKLWAEGLTIKQIALTIKLEVKNPYALISKARKRGWRLPYRQPKSIKNIERANQLHKAKREMTVETPYR